MVSRSTRTKLKIVLFADLLLLAFVIPGYFYVDSLIPNPPKFQVTDLTFDRTWVQIGKPVQISVNITNIGGESGNHSVVLTINDVPITTKTIQVSGKESEIVTFTATRTTEGNYTVKIGDLTGSFKVTSEAPPQPAELQLTNLRSNRAEVGVGEAVTISVMATNLGDVAGDFSLELFVNDQKRKTKSVQLAGGETKTVPFEIVEDMEGDYQVKLGNLTASFRVTSDAQSLKPADFQVNDLTIAPPSVLPDDVVEISVNVTNVGEASEDYNMTLKINGTARETREVKLVGGATEIVTFEVTETTPGTYMVEVAGQSGSFTVENLASASANIKLQRMFVNPYEVWDGEAVTIQIKADNLVDEPATLMVRVLLDGVVEKTKTFSLDVGATDVILEIPVIAEYKAKDGRPEGYSVELVNLGNQTNTLSGFFQVVPEGYHTLSITRSGGGTTPMTFTLNGVKYETPYSELLPVGEYHLSTPKVVDVGTGVVEFSHWSDGVENASRTVILDERRSLMAHFLVISGYASCPSLFIWNGTQYSYVTEISNAGWLGYMDYIKENGEIVFGGGNPWDYIKLNKNQLQPRSNFRSVSDSTLGIELSSLRLSSLVLVTAGITLLILDVMLVKIDKLRGKKSTVVTVVLVLIVSFHLVTFLPFTPEVFSSQDSAVQEGYYDLVLFQQWDEIFYLDTAYLTVVDHPKDTDVYSTMVNYINQGSYGQIYTVDNDSLSPPISATNEKGKNVLPQISQLDGNFTSGGNGLLSPSWNNITLNKLTLNLGNLSDASEIKLVIHGMIDWGPPEPYYEWIGQFKTAAKKGLVPNGTEIYPPPRMEVMDAHGNWIEVPKDRQMPVPADYVPRTFAVNLTGLFPSDVTEYKLRITNFWNVTFDYIGIDTTPQKNITVHKIPPTATLEPLEFGTTTSNSSGRFTRYGNVTPLLLNADDKFVIGRQGDKVSLKFPTADLPPLKDGMERNFFLFVASWFKDSPGNWGYGFEFTVKPLPFQNMSGFPYPPTENYPSSEEYTNYLQKWNTREINIP